VKQLYYKELQLKHSLQKRSLIDKECLKKNTVFLHDPFICDNCRKQFTEEEIFSITNNPFNQTANNIIQREGNNSFEKFEGNNNNKNTKKKYQINMITSPTKIIE